MPHAEFTFAKLWVHFAHFEVRQGKLDAARKLLGIESEEDEPPLPQLVRAPDGELMVCVDAVEGAAAGAPTVAFSPL